MTIKVDVDGVVNNPKTKRLSVSLITPESTQRQNQVEHFTRNEEEDGERKYIDKNRKWSRYKM